ncbi:hypothetical protein ACHQM5_003237 [Ranunculus cassubicifolius]
MSEIQGSIRRLISAPIMDTDPPDTHNSVGHNQNYFVEVVNSEKQLWKTMQSKGILHFDVRELYRKVRSSYEILILNDLELAELQEIEYSLWKLHYKHIDEFRNRIRGSSVTKEHQNLEKLPRVTTVKHKSENYLEGFKIHLSEATEFYHHLIKKMRRSYGLPEDVSEGSISKSVESTRMRRCLFLCHRLLVCLGDLARYRELYGTPDAQDRRWSVAATYYIKASAIWPNSGNPHNQLAVLAVYVGDELLALYHCIRSLAVKEPFPDAWDNLILLFDKNRSSHLRSLSSMVTFNFSKPSESRTEQRKGQSSDSFFNGQLRNPIGDDLTEGTELWPLIVRMMSYFYVKPSLEDFPFIFGSTIRELEVLLLRDDARLKIALESYQHLDVSRTGPFRVLQLVCILIFTIHTLSESSTQQNAKQVKYMQQTSLIQRAFTITFIFMGRLVNRCITADPIRSSPLLPGILVFVEWLASNLDKLEKYATDGKCESAIDYFFTTLVDLLNKIDGETSETESNDSIILWEDSELRGFSPISRVHGSLQYETHQEMENGFEDKNLSRVRICRIIAAAMKTVNKPIGSQKWTSHEKALRKFNATESKELTGKRELVATEAGLDLKARELQEQAPVPYDVREASSVSSGVKKLDRQESSPAGKKLDAQESSPVEEEEEVILFKPITRCNSEPFHLPVTTSSQIPSEGILHRQLSLELPKHEICTDATSYSSKSTSPRNKPLWEEAIPEDSVMDSFSEPTESPRFRELSSMLAGTPSPAGPPSLSAWVLNKDNFEIPVSKQQPPSPSSHLTGLSIGKTEPSKQNSAPAPHVMHAPLKSSAPAPSYMPPVPSAPLLPEDAPWFNGNSSYPVPAYGNLVSTPNFEPYIPSYIDGYIPYSAQANSTQWVHQYEVNVDQPRDMVPPNPTFLYPLRRLENLPFYPNLVTVGEGHKMERLYPAYPGPSPYAAANNLRVEQQLLLKYLKEKERHLQQEAQLGGSA